jgi:hypothetical protein
MPIEETSPIKRPHRKEKTSFGHRSGKCRATKDVMHPLWWLWLPVDQTRGNHSPRKVQHVRFKIPSLPTTRMTTWNSVQTLKSLAPSLCWGHCRWVLRRGVRYLQSVSQCINTHWASWIHPYRWESWSPRLCCWLWQCGVSCLRVDSTNFTFPRNIHIILLITTFVLFIYRRSFLFIAIVKKDL